MKNNRINFLSNKIIKMFIDEKVPISVQLDSLRMAKEKIEFCRKTGVGMAQQKLF